MNYNYLKLHERMNWKNSIALRSVQHKPTQFSYYEKNNSCNEVLQLVKLDSKPFGSISEKIICEVFQLSPRTSSQNDGTKNGKKIEIKCARYWANKDDCVWQHLELEHDYDYVLFALLDFQDWKVWGIQKSILMGELVDKKIVTIQGKQGCWVKKSDILPYLTPIHSIQDLDDSLITCPSNPYTPSKNSIIAKNGFRAETFICSQENIKESFETYFKSPIKQLKRIHGKKFDVQITFENGSETTIQNKDGDGKGRGWSVDRRKPEGFNNDLLTTLLKTVCLKQGTEKPDISNIISKEVINMCMFGVKEEDYPKYFTHTISNKNTGNIISINICPTDKLIPFIYNSLYNVMEPKRTCVHLSPICYLQRKGGGKKDANPDNIQMKFKFTKEIESLFIPLFKQTTPL